MKARFLIILLIPFLINCNDLKDSCGREDFCCKVDGKMWWPSKNGDFKSKDLQVLMDSDGKYLTIEAYNGSSHVSLGVKDTLNQIQVGVYNLTGQMSGRASYSPGAAKLFETDAANTGIVTITKLEKNKTLNVVSGTFTFKAHSPLTGESVNITEGSFSTTYTTL